MERHLVCATLVISALGLTACASTRHSARAALQIPGSSVSLSEDPLSYPGRRIADGKRQLGEHNYGAALTSFREARLDQRHAGEAWNGMAIAYANLGRNDLAELYFTRAANVENADPKFAANLQRFYAQLASNSAGARRAAPQPPEAKLAPADGLRRTPLASLRIAAPSTRLVRLSNSEMMLRTGRPADAEMAIPSRAGSTGIQMARGQVNPPTYPQRIAFSSPHRKTDRAFQTADRGYPVRITLSN